MEDLRNSGWILSESALKTMETSGSSKNLTKTLLDRDLREIGAGIGDLHKGKFESVDHELVVLQIQKIRNISAPKANESSKTAPKLLKLQLTDGVNTYSAIEMEPTLLTIETKPGTKIVLKVQKMKMVNGQLLFTPKNIEILGGHVEALVSKWEVTKSLAGMKGSRGAAAAGGPPPFIPFGQKIQQNVPNSEKGFKSLQNKPKETENDDSEFKAQRQDAIAEATKAGTKKTFGGGSKILIDSNVQKIMDKGYTEEQANTALKYSHNSVDKAISNLKRREESQRRASSNDYEPREYSKDKRGGKGSSAETQGAKPSGAVSLFDFLENKIPTSIDSTAKQLPYDPYEERFENNISSSFRKDNKDISNKSQHWSQNSYGDTEQKSSHNFKSLNSYSGREFRDSGRDHRDQPRDYKGRDYKDFRDSRGKDSKQFNYPSKSNSTASNHYQKPSCAVSNGSNYNSIGKGKYEKTDYNGKPGSEYRKDYSKDYNVGANNSSYNKSRGNNSASTAKYYNDQHSNDYHKSSRNVVDSMEKMTLKGSHHPQHLTAGEMKLSTSNYPPLIPSSEPSKSKAFTQKPGYPIVGFQNKEANEHAKNALKTKNIPGIQQQHQQKQPPQQPHPQVAKQHSTPVTVISHQTIKTQPPPPFSNVASSGQNPMHSMPQPFVQHQAHPVIHAMPASAVISANSTPVYHQAISFPTPIIMQSVQPPPGMGPPNVNNLHPMKVGDLCLAKYWEDGQYYSAKITNACDSTYVVLFTDYGNAEEVRKTDCVPFMPACLTPPHNSANFTPAPQINTYGIPAHKMSHHNYHHQPMPYKNVPGKNQRRN